MDKSTIQGLSSDHFQYISRYYTHLISPILLRELTSGLAKEDKKKSEAALKKDVSTVAARTNSPQSIVLPDAHMMAYTNLMGNFIPMDGRIPREFGIPVDVQGLGRGTCFSENPYIPLLRKWSNGNFSEEDYLRAKAIRNEDANINLVSLLGNEEKTLTLPKFNTLEEMVIWADKVHFSPSNPKQLVLNAASNILGYCPEHFEKVMQRWELAGRPELKTFAPYAFHYFRVDMILILSLLCGFTKRSKKGKAHLDAQYLHYLPFCHIFSTEDKDLKKLASLFLNKDQVFIDKTDLQNDLKAISQFFETLSKDDAEAFHLEYGIYPPDLENSFTSKVWKQFMRPKRPKEGEMKTSPAETEANLKQVKAIEKALEEHLQDQNLHNSQAIAEDGKNPSHLG